MKKKNELKYTEWTNYLISTREKTNYSIRRMDLLVISISSGGLYVFFETIKHLKTNKIEIDSHTLFFSGIFFVLAIIINLLSQLSGYYSNNYEEKYINIELSKLKINDTSDSCEQNRYDRLINLFDKLTNILNAISLMLLFTGLSYITYFYYLGLFPEP